FLIFQTEDGIRDRNVTGVQTYALPICTGADTAMTQRAIRADMHVVTEHDFAFELAVHINDAVRAHRQRAAHIEACRITQRQSRIDRKSTRLNSSHVSISYAVFCLKTKK